MFDMIISWNWKLKDMWLVKSYALRNYLIGFSLCIAFARRGYA